MNGFAPQLTALAATVGVLYVMTYSGVSKHVLEWRQSSRRCPSCGRHIEARVCARCTS
jgi:exosome complex RNA-binding protein Csl4